MEENFTNIIDSASQFTDEWNKNNENYNAWRSTDPFYLSWYNEQRLAMSEQLYPVWKSLKGKKILDFGCGTGFEFFLLQNLGAEIQDYAGIEISSKIVEDGKTDNPNLNLLFYDGQTIPFPDNHFDLCTCFAVFCCIRGPELRKQLGSEIRRVVKPGGYIYWFDLMNMLKSATGESDELDPKQLWPGLPVIRKYVSPYPLPGTGLRPLKGFKKILKPVFDKLGYPPKHLSALIGPNKK